VATSPPAQLEQVRAHKRPVRASLLRWFGHAKRDLPWRRTSDPYAIWLSEIMLQQTQVDRVVPYFERFLERFPTVKHLARAPLDDVLSEWKGLGYYSRARNLHAAAKVIVAEHHATLPASHAALLALPGFGRYTAGAVASIAFGLPTPLVDGNVARVFARLFVIEGAAGDKQREALLWSIAELLIDGANPGDFNQSLMELGATVCLPNTAPLCLLCPVAQQCGALQAGRVTELPVPKKAAPRKALSLAVAIARRQDRVLLARRVDAGLFGGLWELPSTEHGTDGPAALAQLLGRTARIGAELDVVTRTLTHRDLQLHLYATTLPQKLAAPPTGYTDWRWFEPAEVAGLGISSATQAALDVA
jgi:A/G-specific adenine glycosylase